MPIGQHGMHEVRYFGSCRCNVLSSVWTAGVEEAMALLIACSRPWRASKR